MPSLDARLLALEQHNRASRPALLLFYQCEQDGRPTPEQAAQIEQAEKQGRPVNVIRFVRAENLFLGFSGLSPKR